MVPHHVQLSHESINKGEENILIYNFATSLMRKITLLILLFLILLPVTSSESWSGYVKTTGDSWFIYRESQNISFNLEQSIKGNIEPIRGPCGRVLRPYGSYFEDAKVNDVRLRERTAASEGNYSSDELVDVRAKVNPPVGLSIVKPAESDVYSIDFFEIWPANISASRSLEYSGKGINDREFAGNNLDFVGANLLYNKELSKDLNLNMGLEKMNATVLATDNSIIRAERKATRDLDFNLQTHTTGIADLKYQQSGPEYNDVPITGYKIPNYGDERYYGVFNITRHIHMKSRFDELKPDDYWLPCCYQGWVDMNNLDKIGHSSDGIFNCTCSSLQGGRP